MGWNAPGIANRDSFLQAAHHVNLAHGEAVRTLRALAPAAKLGAIYNRQICLPATATPADTQAAGVLDACWNRLYADPQCLAEYPPELADGIGPYVHAGDIARIAQPIDWFGLNHYSPIYARADTSLLGFAWATPPTDGPLTGVGWRIDPDAFRNELIATYKRYKLPVYVTENGAAPKRRPMRRARWTIPAVSTICAPIPGQWRMPTTPELTCVAILPGLCWITSNGARDTQAALGLFMWIMKPRSEFPNLLFIGLQK